MSEDWSGEERRGECAMHKHMVEQDENMGKDLADANRKIGESETKFKLMQWLAAAMFLVALGSLSALISVGYNAGALVQSVKNSADQIEKVERQMERHNEKLDRLADRQSELERALR